MPKLLQRLAMLVLLWALFTALPFDPASAKARYTAGGSPTSSVKGSNPPRRAAPTTQEEGLARILDYGDQAEITPTMRNYLQRRIEESCRESAWSGSFQSAAVEFKEAGASSLDHYVRVDLDGSAAFDYQAQNRDLARFCVDVCNERGWRIPFTQLTLHVADPNAETDGPARDGASVESAD
jgi:hypothetical protein